MPSLSHSQEAPDGIDVETVDSVDGPRFRSIASTSPRPNGDPQPGYHHRVRVAALAAEVEKLEAEVEALERAVESKEQQRQQVIDNYETIVRARSAAPRTHETNATPVREVAAGETPTTETANGGPLVAVASRIERIVGWVRRSTE